MPAGYGKVAHVQNAGLVAQGKPGKIRVLASACCHDGDWLHLAFKPLCWRQIGLALGVGLHSGNGSPVSCQKLYPDTSDRGTAKEACHKDMTAAKGILLDDQSQVGQKNHLFRKGNHPAVAHALQNQLVETARMLFEHLVELKHREGGLAVVLHGNGDRSPDSYGLGVQIHVAHAGLDGFARKAVACSKEGQKGWLYAFCLPA